MIHFIGGLLVVSILSRPIFFDSEAYAYNIFRNGSQIIYVLKKEEGEEISLMENTDIDRKMSELERGMRRITELIKEKEAIAGKMETVMDLYAYAGNKLDQEQMNQYQKFASTYPALDNELQVMLTELRDLNQMKRIEKEILNAEMDMDSVYYELSKVNHEQNRVVEWLEEMVSIGRNTLSMLI